MNGVYQIKLLQGGTFVLKISLDCFFRIFFDLEDFAKSHNFKPEDFEKIHVYFGDPDPRSGQITYELTYPKHYRKEEDF